MEPRRLYNINEKQRVEVFRAFEKLNSHSILTFTHYLHISRVSSQSERDGLVGLFLNPGQTWCWMGREGTHDFRSQSFGVALPYGIYDPQRNAGRSSSATPPNSPSRLANHLRLVSSPRGR